VPDFVRESLARQGVPGLKVFRWERHWHTEGQPFRRLSEYPAASVAVSGTHDTEPMIVWWERASAEEKIKVSAGRVAWTGDRPVRAGSRRDRRSALRVSERSRPLSDSGCLRLERSDQRPVRRGRPQLGVSAAVAERQAR